MSANDRQVGGDHYKMKIQPWDAMEAWMTPEQFRGFLLGDAIKYLSRSKHGREDIEKAQHYIEKYLEVTGDDMPSGKLGLIEDKDTPLIEAGEFEPIIQAHMRGEHTAPVAKCPVCNQPPGTIVEMPEGWPP